MKVMRYWGWLLIVGLVAVLSLSVLPTSVQADQLLQGVPRLDGKKIYFTESSLEASRFDRTDNGLSRFAGLLTQLGASLYTLEWRTGFPDDADLIVIAGPVIDLQPDQIARLWSYMNNKGRVLILANPIFETRRALASSNGLFQLMWADMGLLAHDDVVVTEGTQPIYATPEAVAPEAVTPEAAATEAAAAVTEAPTVESTPTELPIIGQQPILISDFETGDVNQNSPIAQDLGGDLAFFTARSLEVDSSIQGFVVQPLVFSPSNFYGETRYDIYQRDGTFEFNIGADTTRGALPLAASYRNDKTDVRIVVVGDREFATNGAGFSSAPPNSAGFIHPANVRFMLNAVTWLLDTAPVSVQFPTAGPTSTPTITPSPTPTFTPTPTETPVSAATGEAKP